MCLSGESYTVADWDSSDKGIHTGKYVIIRRNLAESCVASETDRVVKETQLCETPGKPSM